MSEHKDDDVSPTALGASTPGSDGSTELTPNSELQEDTTTALSLEQQSPAGDGGLPHQETSSPRSTLRTAMFPGSVTTDSLSRTGEELLPFCLQLCFHLIKLVRLLGLIFGSLLA